MSSSKSLKRSRAQEDETDMHIKTAEGEPLPAESFMLRTFSLCAKQLPADTAEWDVSGLMYQGEPFTHAAVKCWLGCAFTVLNGSDELDADDKAQLSTAKGLHAVLTFAHAVGSKMPVCTAACSQLDSLQMVVQLPEQTLELPVSGHSYVFEDGRLLREWPPGSFGQPVTQQQEKQVQQQIAEQTGALLHMAHVLRVDPLISRLHDFVWQNYRYNNNVLFGVLELVFSDSTIEAALGSSSISRQAYLDSVLTRPCSFVSNAWGHTTTLKPVGDYKQDAQTGVQQFDADVLQPFAGLRVGDRVKVQLDLYRTVPNNLMITGTDLSMSFPAQLLLGLPGADSPGTEAWPLLFSSRLPQP